MFEYLYQVRMDVCLFEGREYHYDGRDWWVVIGEDLHKLNNINLEDNLNTAFKNWREEGNELDMD